MTVFPTPIIPPNTKLQLTDKSGLLTVPGNQFLQQVWTQLAPCLQVIPCTETFAANVYTLTPFPISSTFTIQKYVDFITFAFVASDTSTGNVTALITGLSALKVFNTTGSQIGAGGITATRQYFLTYASNYDSSNGGFVLR